MKNITKKIVLGCAAISLSSLTLLASAQDKPMADCKTQANPQECRQAQFTKMRAEREAKWHDELKITPEQESAWKAFIESHHAMKAERKEQRGEMKDTQKLSAPDRLEQHLARMHEHETAMKAHLVTLKALYAKLSPEQQAQLDNKLSQFDKHKRRAHGSNKKQD